MNIAKILVNDIKRDEEILDYVLVESTRDEMLAKLERKRNEGKTGWGNRYHINNKELMQMLKANLERGDMIDVINLAAMINARNILYGEPIPSPWPLPKRERKKANNDSNN